MFPEGCCIAILGPTCCWKSECAIRLAKQLDGEIISCDSMQIYQGLEIGTAKPSLEERAEVPHHLIDGLNISEPFDANRFVLAAETALQEIRSRKKIPVLAGGTGLYARALIYGFEMLPSDPALAKQLQAEIVTPGGNQRLLRFLEERVEDKKSIPEEIYLNPRRLLRACEVLQLTGKPPWLLAKRLSQPKPAFRQFCILPEFPLLKERIRLRTGKMLAQGWEREALEAENAGLMATPTARQALGYRDILEFNRQGRPGGDGALLDLLANRTIQYARRQLTWFRHQHPGAVQILVHQEADAVNFILESIRSSLL